jgi:DNA-binding IclR family transcriptional regulator
MQQDRIAGGVQAVALALQILEMLAIEGKPTRVTDLANALGTSKTRIFRHLQTLVKLGYVTQDTESERYYAGARLAQLGGAVANQFSFRNISRPIMQRLRDSVGPTVMLSKVDNDVIYSVDQVEGKSILTVRVTIGRRLTLYSTAQGKLVLAFGVDGILDRVIKRGLKAETRHTITKPNKFRAEIKNIRERGWASAANESLVGLNAIAMPIFESNNRLFGTIAIIGSTEEVPADPPSSMLAGLRDAAEQISQQMAERGMVARNS